MRQDPLLWVQAGALCKLLKKVRKILNKVLSPEMGQSFGKKGIMSYRHALDQAWHIVLFFFKIKTAIGFALLLNTKSMKGIHLLQRLPAIALIPRLF